MDMMEEQLIEKVFDLVKDYEGDPNKLLKSVTSKVMAYQSEEQQALREKNKDELKKVAEEIFKLCPDCNLIPVAVETGSEDVFTTYTSLEDIWETCSYYLMDPEDNHYEIAMPHQTDDMTFGTWKKINELWDKMIMLAGYKYGTSNDGDYCNFYHVCVYGFSKRTKMIEEYDDVNR